MQAYLKLSLPILFLGFCVIGVNYTNYFKWFLSVPLFYVYMFYSRAFTRNCAKGKLNLVELLLDSLTNQSNNQIEQEKNDKDDGDDKKDDGNDDDNKKEFEINPDDNKKNEEKKESFDYNQVLYINCRLVEEILHFVVYFYLVVYYLTCLFNDSFQWYKGYLNERYNTSFILTQRLSYEDISEHNLNYYLSIQAQFYIVLLLMVFIKPIKKDYKIMSAHHISAFLGVIAGMTFDMKVETSMVLFLHDICDVFLQLMILSHKLKSFFAVVYYLIFFTLHVVCRVLIFPFIAVTTTLNHANYYNPSNWIALISCCPIWFFHLYWSYRLYKIGDKYTAISSVEDYREKQFSTKNNTKKKILKKKLKKK